IRKLQCALNKGTRAAGALRADAASAVETSDGSTREEKNGTPEGWPDCAAARAAARLVPAVCSVASVVGAGVGAPQQGIPHAPGTLQWQPWQQTQWQAFNSSTGCTRTKAANATARRTHARRLMALRWTLQRAEQPL